MFPWKTLRRALTAYPHWSRRRDTNVSLHGLDDGMLRGIGIRRSNVGAATTDALGSWHEEVPAADNDNSWFGSTRASP